MASSDGKGRGRIQRTRVRASIDEERGVFMISVAAELAEMHPQTLRMYEARGLINPKRSPKNTRLYSQRDVERLRRIQQMTSEEGLNLAGVETVLEMETRVEKMRAELERMRKQTEELQRQMAEEVERVRRSLRAEIVPYKAYDVLPTEGTPRTIPVDRPDRGDS
jgi:MerR family transcriptional regulator/heat shock protein HspR